MRIVFIGCVQFSHSMLEHVLQEMPGKVVGVVTRDESSFNSDFYSLKELAQKNKLPCHIATGNKQQPIVDFIKKLNPDVVYCFGWSYLLKKDILSIPRLGVVGYHPSALPKNRGRHPLIWAIALGIKNTASTFFAMDEGADSGDVLSQESLVIEDDDDAWTLYQKMTKVALRQVVELTTELEKGHFKRIKQDHSQANVWRKRTEKDGEIDWRMTSKGISNLIRALTRPYVGSHFKNRGVSYKVWKAERVDLPNVENIEPGKVLQVDNGMMTVKCGEGCLKIIDHDMSDLPQEGEYLK